MDYEVKLVRDFAGASVRLFLYYRRGQNQIVFIHPSVTDDKGHTTLNHTVVDDINGAIPNPIPPFMEFPMSFMMEFPDFFAKLMQELNEFGIKSPDKSFVEGKLAATEEHLRDMRKIVFGFNEQDQTVKADGKKP